MKNEMYEDLLDYIDESFVEVAEKLIGTTVTKNNSLEFDSEKDFVSVLVELQRSNSLVLLMTVEMATAKNIAEAMNLESFESELEIIDYVSEFFNTFCGKGTSDYNKENAFCNIHVSPPKVIANQLAEELIRNEMLRSNFYTSRLGAIRLILSQSRK
ncbi:MAG: chemotaxis protein CheX [Syntrophomonadaceae bacterium]|nr:chemotaxis protein CheX [Syntrophomonadaceae bacterium]